MGSTDRAIRIFIVIVIGVLYFTGKIGGTLAIVSGIVAIVFLVTSLIGWCPGYVPFGLSTQKPSGGASK
jgi:hypothetical protein